MRIMCIIVINTLGILITKWPVTFERSAAESVVFTSSGKANCKVYRGKTKIFDEWLTLRNKNAYFSFDNHSNISRLNIHIDQVMYPYDEKQQYREEYLDHRHFHTVWNQL